jgi:hypothetical protein
MNHFTRCGLLAGLFLVASLSIPAQFKEMKAAPFSPAVARQKIRTLLAAADAGNRDQTIATLSDWLKWYRDILDEELIARWKTDGRANLPLIMAPLADARVAREVIEFSWRTGRPGAFTLAYASTLGDLMARYPESAKPFLDDLLPPPGTGMPALNLTEPEAEAVCRILIDMPDIGTWRKSAQQILPRYRAAADQVLKQDLQSPDQERIYRALRWRADLKLDPPAVSSQKASPRPNRPSPAWQTASDAYSQRPHLVGQQPSTVAGYTGPMSGTFESSGDPIPRNGEYVFPNIPPVKLLLDFDTKHWEARLAPGEGQTQILVLRNKSKGPQKRCVVHWTVVP